MDQKESRLRNQFQQAIRFYAAYLYEVGMRGRFSQEGVLELPLSAWREARAAMEWPHLREGNEERFQRLRALGLGVTQGKGSVRVLNRDFPKMMFGLWALCAAPKTAYHRTNYLRLDYAGALRGSPALEDVFRVLSPVRAQQARQLHKAAEQAGFRGKIRPLREITSGSFWKVEYSREGKVAAVLYAAPEGLNFGLHLGAPQRAQGFLERAGKEAPALEEWLRGRLQEQWEPKPGGPVLWAQAEEPSPQDTDALAALLGLVRECYFKAEEK